MNAAEIYLQMVMDEAQIDPPDIVKHDAKYHHGHYDPTKGKCKYREDRGIAVNGKSGEDYDKALEGLNPEDVEGEEIDKVDMLPEEKRENKKLSPKTVWEQKRKAAQSEEEAIISKAIKKIQNRQRYLLRTHKTKTKEDEIELKQLAEQLEQEKEKSKEYKRRNGIRIYGEFPSRGAVLNSERVNNISSKINNLQQQIKEHPINPNNPYAIDPRNKEIENLKRKLEDQKRKDVDKLNKDADIYGIGEERVYYLNGDETAKMVVRWDRNRECWIRIDSKCSPKALHMKFSSRQEDRKKMSEETKEKMKVATQMKRENKAVKEAGLDPGVGNELYNTYIQTVRKKRFNLNGFKKWLSKIDIPTYEKEAKENAKPYIPEVVKRRAARLGVTPEQLNEEYYRRFEYN